MVYQLEEHVDWFSTECWSISWPSVAWDVGRVLPITSTNTQPIVLVDTWLTGVLSKHDPYILATETKPSVGNQRSCPSKKLLFVPAPSPHPHQTETEPGIAGIVVTIRIQTCSQSPLISNGANEKFLWSRSLWSWLTELQERVAGCIKVKMWVKFMAPPQNCQLQGSLCSHVASEQPNVVEGMRR